MPTVTYMLELTEDELMHLFALLNLRELKIGPIDDQEISILSKVERLVQGK
jgi:hypothetical protein